MDVVLLHSGVTDSGEWDAVKPLLEGQHRVLTPDLPGSGAAPLEPGELSLADFVLGLDFERAALVGTSFGARAELETALAAPERVEALVLVSPNPFGWSEEVASRSTLEDELADAGRFEEAADLMVRTWVDGPQRGPDGVPAELRDRVRAMQRRAYELQDGIDASLRRVEIEPSAVQVPILVVRGALDWDDVARASARFVSEAPDAREVVLDGCAHLPALERPREFAVVILDFLAALDRGRGGLL